MPQLLHVVIGPVLVKYNSAELGYTRDGVRVSVEPKLLDVPCDTHGGEAGAPSDIQVMGGIARINCEFTKFDKTQIDALTAFVRGGQAGTLPAFGTLLRQDGKTAPLVLAGSAETLTFGVAFVRNPIESNKGTRYSTTTVAFEAHVDSPTMRRLFSIG